MSGVGKRRAAGFLRPQARIVHPSHRSLEQEGQPMEQPDLTGKTALVTGGGRGIGRATSLMLADYGARVVVTARGRTEIDDAAAEIARRGGEALAIPADVSRKADVRALFDQSPPVDILINNASIIHPISPLATADVDDWLYNMEVNLASVFLTCRQALPSMLERGWGRIINVSSGAARGSTAGWSAYGASKAGVEALTAVVAREVGDRGVRANAVRPGIVDTEMQAEIRASSDEQFGHDNLQRYRGYKERGLLRAPEDPARLILWLLTDEASEVNGQVLAIDDPEVAARIGVEPRGR